MKFLQFYKNNEPALGLVTEAGVIDVGANEGCPKTMLELCRLGDVSPLAALTGPILKEEDLTFLAESAFADACAPGNPRETSVEDLTALFRKIM